MTEGSERYVELKRMMVRGALLEQQPLYYALRMVLNFCMLAASITVLVTVQGLGWQLLDAVFLGFVCTQMGFIVHDSGHHQVTRSGRINDAIGIFHAVLLLGFSYARWTTTHNLHHGQPNRMGIDPDTDYFVFALSPDQARQRRGAWRWTSRHQARLFFPILMAEAVNLKVDCIRFLLRNKQARCRTVEFACLAVHFAVYLGGIFHVLKPLDAVLFVLVHQAVFGFYLAMVIVPNHIGRPIAEVDPGLDFLTQQVSTTRTLRRSVVTDYLYGPLACQIEHHLFPTMSLNKLRKAQRVVRPFCEQHGLDYCETTPLQAYREIIRHLRIASAPLHHESRQSGEAGTM